MRAYAMITALWMLPCTLFSQTNISGVVNSYYKVVGINYTNSGLKLDNVNGLAVNDRVMIIQMKGATVNTISINSSSFGAVSSLNQAGNYELATVCSVSNDSVYLLQQLLRTYTVTDKVQLVKIPRYVSATVTGPMEAALWDSSSGKGGVLALVVSGTLSLNAPVSASAKGFKGGVFYKDGGGCASNAFLNYVYDPTPTTYLIYSNVQRGAWKGESVCDLTLAFNGGRGACANGGGGGNNHNNGGGGGSNLATAGKAGDNLSTTGCAGQQAGIGGYALSSNGSRIFFGGGGGAGHANNTSSSSGGGYGGGIIFIQAQTLVSNGFTISANGSAGGNTNGDGASGGGGGGTILLSVSNYADAISVEAKGGNGGQVDDESISGRCYGEGGGGSGGVVYFSGVQPAGTVNVAGGIKGVKLNSTCASSTGTNGSAGSQVINYQLMESVVLSGCGSMVLDVNWLYFKVNISGASVLLQWAASISGESYFLVERRKEEQWIPLTRIEGRIHQTEYSFRDICQAPGTYLYRLKLVSHQKISYSSIKQVSIKGRQQLIRYDAVTQQVFVTGIEKDDLLRIFDLSGACIYQKKFMQSAEAWQSPVSLKNGMYIAKMARAETKFIVAR